METNDCNTLVGVYLQGVRDLTASSILIRHDELIQVIKRMIDDDARSGKRHCSIYSKSVNVNDSHFNDEEIKRAIDYFKNDGFTVEYSKYDYYYKIIW